MRIVIGLLAFVGILTACKEKGKRDKINPAAREETSVYPAGMRGVDKWFVAWEFISTHKFELPQAAVPAILLYDDKFVYTTSAVSAPDSAAAFEGPALLGQPLSWKWGPHHGTLMIPDSQKVPVGLMSFAAADKNKRAFFVMAAPSFWQTAGVTSKELGLEKLMTAVFLHEFAHTRQQQGMGVMVDSIEKRHPFQDPALSDDIVQHVFQQDSNYVRSFRAEVEKLYAAVAATDTQTVKRLTREGLALLRQRQATYFKKEQAVLKALDDIFLTMEGLGQFAGFYWLHHPKGANVPYDLAVEGMRRKRNQWSQEEGLALFLILDKLTVPNWSKDVFGEHPKNIIELLTAAVR